MEDHGP